MIRMSALGHTDRSSAGTYGEEGRNTAYRFNGKHGSAQLEIASALSASSAKLMRLPNFAERAHLTILGRNGLE
jgi:hypothetical protein